jgi:hypothetical protein
MGLRLNPPSDRTLEPPATMSGLGRSPGSRRATQCPGGDGAKWRRPPLDVPHLPPSPSASERGRRTVGDPACRLSQDLASAGLPQVADAHTPRPVDVAGGCFL